ncbi:acyl carrier protein [Aliiroseovarius sp. Z3]|uniref:acyl carrier protein n=1 Tax=Aliiroseovarius sp. Z3 TaxID=2811402 RepID=UPI0023B23ED6|nr:acyl carrier protein [Aliiroseovarius sp. Z3]MDE9449058.1 acyl carrier protein [Aliiroseovarius sp. Z3]
MSQFTHATFLSILQEQFPDRDWSELSEEASLEDVGIDSLDKATLVMKVEEVAGVTISDELYDELNTPRNIVELVVSQ